MIKKELRKVYKQKRLALSATERMKMDDLLLIQFQRLAFDDVNVVMSFSPLETSNEVNSDICARYLQHLIPGLVLCYPVIDVAINTMNAVLVDDTTNFTENIYGIAEPVGPSIIEPLEIDLVLVPLITFDAYGHRVGYGKGYYDKFLKQCHEKVITIGFSYFEAVDIIEDTNQYDVPLSYCITPQKVYEF